MKNLMNGEMFVQLADAWQEVRYDDENRVAVVTAVGEEDFCCGGDLGELIPLWTGAKQPENALEERLLADPLIADKVMLKDEPIYKPIIAAINGRALGGGTELLQATDIRIAAEHAQFSLPEPKSGVVPGAGSMVRLARQLPYPMRRSRSSTPPASASTSPRGTSSTGARRVSRSCRKACWT